MHHLLVAAVSPEAFSENFSRLKCRPPAAPQAGALKLSGIL
jgi:hypothetical protein